MVHIIRIGAHYYPWYGKVSNSILGGGNWESGIAHTPCLGKYLSEDEEIIKEHVRMAKKAGIAFFILEWTGPRLYEDQIIRNHCIPIFETMQMPFCIMYDSYFSLQKTETIHTWDLSSKYDYSRNKGEKLLQDFEYLNSNYFNHPLYFSLHSRPLVMIFLAYKFLDQEGYFKKIKGLKTINGVTPYLIGDIISAYSSATSYSVKEIGSYLFNTSLSTIYSRICNTLSINHQEKESVFSELDAFSGYNLINTKGVVLQNYENVLQTIRKKGIDYKKEWIPFIFPGYNDKNLRGSGRERHTIERGFEGEFYRNIINIVKKNVDPRNNLILLTSFNEWHEGTEIEPSKQYGDLFLNITSDLVHQ